jgi:DNA-directed RNA polymerase subunit F
MINIRAMYKLLAKAYKEEGAKEVALVFMTVLNSKPAIHIYDTSVGSFFLVKETLIENKTISVLFIGNAIEKLEIRAKEACCKEYYLTAIHNHRNSSLFCFVDLYTFFTNAKMQELFLDTTTIYYIKKLDNLSPEQNERLLSIMVETVENNKGSLIIKIAEIMLQFDIRIDEYVKDGNELTEEVLRFFNKQRKAAIQPFLEQFADECWDKIFEEFGSRPFDRGKIDKDKWDL